MRLLATCLCALGLTLIIAPLQGRSAAENVNMNLALSVENGHLVAHWSALAFDHYNVRWSENGGPARQIERDGDKAFVYVTPFRRGVVYTVSVQGCESHFLGRSTCTSWDALTCGDPRNPCTGPRPREIRSGGGLCLDVHAPDQLKNGGRVQLWTCNNSEQQLWTVRGHQIVSFAGKCLDAHLPDLNKNGGRVQVWDCNNSIQQSWSWRGQQVRSGGGKCLDAHLPTLRQDGCAVQIWDCNQTVQQRWSQPSTL